MKNCIGFVRVLFLILSMTLFALCASLAFAREASWESGILGLLFGLGFAAIIVIIDLFIQVSSVRLFLVLLVGSFLGYLLGETILLIYQSALGTVSITPENASFAKIALFLITTYLGMGATARLIDSQAISMPFLRNKEPKQKDLLLDITTLCDSRIIDLAASGILDDQLVIPRCLVQELHFAAAENTDEAIKTKARNSIEILKRLEALPLLKIRYSDVDFPEVKDSTRKLIQIAHQLQANIIAADTNRVQHSSIEGIRIINVNALANTFKPLTPSGEFLSIKIQRYGKEPRQGVGYLDDGTMVVVNGGAEFIGETIRAQVLSIKHTTSGRIIFCNAIEDSLMVGLEMPNNEPITNRNNY